MDGPPENDFCSICHSDFNVPCQANCSHWFCGRCILQVWDHGDALHSCKCPLCRREITLLVPADASTRQRPMGDVEILQRIERYNRLYGERSIGLVQMIVSLIYVLSPVDFVPEGLLGIVGLLDDLIIVFICILHVAALYRAVLVSRHGGSQY